MTQRIPKVESLVQHTVAAALVTELERDAATVTVTRVDVSPDLRHAIVWLGLLGPKKDHERILKLIGEHQYSLQASVAKHMSTKFVPRLIFRPDGGGAYAAEIERLLRKIP